VPVTRPFVAVRTTDQWLRCAHRDTSLDVSAGVVALAWTVAAPGSSAVPPPSGAGLAFDSECRLFHSLPEEGRVERLLWAAYDPLHPRPDSAQTIDLFGPPAQDGWPWSDGDTEAGDFVSAEPASPPFVTPRGVAVDAADRLFVAESGAGAVLVFDLPSRRRLRRIALAATPLDLAAHGLDVYLVTQSPPGLSRISAHTEPVALPLPAGVTAPARVALDAHGGIYLLDRAGQAEARVVPLDAPALAFELADAEHPDFLATDIELDGEGRLVIAGAPGADFRRFRLDGAARSEEPPLRAAGYDGRGIVRTPDSRIAYWSARGLRHALVARLRYERRGRVTTFRLDSGRYQTAWGRLFVDACIPAGTAVRVHCIATDEPPEGSTIPPGRPSNVTPTPGKDVVPHPELTPPLPPVVLALGEGGDEATRLQNALRVQALHRRETGRELPWSRPAADDLFETYEAPVLGTLDPVRPGVGRYLWVALELTGDTRTTPRLRAVRAEHPSHDLLRRLPRVFSRDDDAASFLQRYLAPLEGALTDLEARGAERRALLDPRSTPEELLPWLGGFLGLVLDGRWSASVRRKLIAEAVTLFRFRGTLRGLLRFLRICLDVDVLIVEHWRLRGVGAARLGPGGEVSNAVLGAGFRVGGALGEADWHPLEGSVADAFRTHAHRFSVIVPAPLGDEQLAMVRDLLDRHRPAHTLYELCTVEGGMRVGLGLLVELTSVVGPSGGFRPLTLGSAVLGREALLGEPWPLSRVGSVAAVATGEWTAGATVARRSSAAPGEWRPAS